MKIVSKINELTFKSKKAFTLIEMVVAITIFTIFISMIVGTYLYIARAQSDTAETRKVYSGSRDVIEAMSEDVMEYDIFYDCYEGVITGVLECSSAFDLSHGNPAEYLALTDGERAVVYYEEDDNVYLSEYDYYDGGWISAVGFEDGALELSGMDFEVGSLYFRIFPYVDPVENYDDISVQYQPYVTIFMDNFQTSVSTRLYE